MAAELVADIILKACVLDIPECFTYASYQKPVSSSLMIAGSFTDQHLFASIRLGDLEVVLSILTLSRDRKTALRLDHSHSSSRRFRPRNNTQSDAQLPCIIELCLDMCKPLRAALDLEGRKFVVAFEILIRDHLSDGGKGLARGGGQELAFSGSSSCSEDFRPLVGFG
jgi:hypothetical protein